MNSQKAEYIPKREIYRLRITPLINQVYHKNGIYQERFDKTERIESLTTEMQYFPLEQFMAISDEDLLARLKRVLSLELIYGMLDDFTPEQMQAFDEAMARR